MASSGNIRVSYVAVANNPACSFSFPPENMAFLKKKPNAFYPIKMKQSHKRVSTSFKLLRFNNVVIQCSQPHNFMFLKKNKESFIISKPTNPLSGPFLYFSGRINDPVPSAAFSATPGSSNISHDETSQDCNETQEIAFCFPMLSLEFTEVTFIKILGMPVKPHRGLLPPEEA